MTITVLAIILLILRIIATVYLGKVIKKQKELLQLPIDNEIRGFRAKLFYLTIALFLSNFPPIIIDVVFAAKGLGLAWIIVSNTALLSFYAAGNAVSAALAAVLIHQIYRDALKVDQTHPASDHMLMNNE